ncbi:GNAT family N-acetyltransferase [Mycobacteroides salmoniphilum]|uniref:GNAT family N-acetyltransferase n=1 Tax=Mycobacteroides salmoniphilum TaxID=404941 RepID=UPI000991FB56|nr:GNAT family N-acetyltransferase [Mycobacteroides salmoniphilum]QCH25225.1 putative N-acetyltransferase YsnE [Mycobacteroides salmoniphilum]
MAFLVTAADFKNATLLAFLQAHLDDMAPTAPPGSRHALDAVGLQKPGIRMWVASDGQNLVGTVALVRISACHEELKSMRTDPRHRGLGVASMLLAHALDDAKHRGVYRISLETGSMGFFAPAREFYRKHGFVACGPFGNYVEDPHSIFMTLAIQ